LVRAHRWRRRIESGQAKSITELSEQEGVTDAYVCRLLPLTCLAPDIGTILEGACVRRGGDEARHIQAFTNVPRHIPRLALRAWFSASR
jgi:hypothetical protein